MYTLFTHQYLWNKFKWNFYFRVRVYTRLRTSTPAKSACAICWAKIITVPVPSVEKTLYYTLTLKQKFHLNLFQRYWWVKSVYIFLGHSVVGVGTRRNVSWWQVRARNSRSGIWASSTTRVSLQLISFIFCAGRNDNSTLYRSRGLVLYNTKLFTLCQTVCLAVTWQRRCVMSFLRICTWSVCGTSVHMKSVT